MKTLNFFVLILSLTMVFSNSFAQKPKTKPQQTQDLQDQLQPGESLINGWFIRETKGDALLGTKSDTQYFYMKGKRTLSIYPEQELLMAGDETVVFDIDHNDRVQGILGFYDENENLVEKSEQNFYCYGGNYSKAVPSKLVAQYVFSYIKNKKGYVRFVISTYGNSDLYDLTVPCLNNE